MVRLSLIPEKAKELFEKYDMHHIGIVNELDKELKEGKISKYSILNNSIYAYLSTYISEEWHPDSHKPYSDRTYRRRNRKN